MEYQSKHFFFIRNLKMHCYDPYLYQDLNLQPFWTQVIFFVCLFLFFCRMHFLFHQSAFVFSFQWLLTKHDIHKWDGMNESCLILFDIFHVNVIWKKKHENISLRKVTEYYFHPKKVSHFKIYSFHNMIYEKGHSFICLCWLILSF